MPYHPVYIDEGSYIIEDRDYGHRFCRVDFLDIREDLTHEDMTELLVQFTSKIQEKLEENQECLKAKG